MSNAVAERRVSEMLFWNATTGACETNYSYQAFAQWEADLNPNCCVGGLMGIDVYRSPVIAIIWIFILFYIFLGVALGAEVFMTAIEVVTSKESTRKSKDPEGNEQVVHVRVWNATVANLTLMALGSSAPEILLSVIEVVLVENFNSGELGPSTIVGSAAFNLMVITAVCITCLPAGEKRTLKQLGVFLTTAFYSVLAYIWLLLMVVVITPEVIDVWEAVVTCVLLIILIIHAYVVDKQATTAAKKKYLGVKGGAKPGKVSKSEAAAAVKAAKLGKDATPDQIKEALEQELLPPKSKLHYRKQAMGSLSATQVVHNKVSPSDGVVVDGTPQRSKIAEDEVAVNADAAGPGVIKWAKHRTDVMESGGAITLEVERVGGTKGAVSVSYATKNQSAVAGKDYEDTSGTLEWSEGESGKKSVTIAIFDDDEFEKDEEFTVVLADPKGGATFPVNTDGGAENDVCTVTIINDDDRATRLVEAIRMLRLDADSLDLAGDDWMGQIKEAIVPPSGGVGDKIMWVLMCPWKIVFACCPPPALCGGWPCFVVSLALIGGQVVLINDFASQVGCQMYIKTTITAITIVALGTSLPDTFASMQAARGDKWADNSVGNVTGSNSVNVFFGLGVPWLFGSLFWAISGSTPDGQAKFAERFGPGRKHELPPQLYADYYPTGAFIVRKGDLGNSVIVFTVCAIITIGLVLVRRAMGAQELGGNRTGALASGAFLVFLWFVYITMSCLFTYGLV